ncbi:hypothetical protein BD779DRAFT_1430579, partial [Infundibulicybe gibba]
MTKIVNNLSAKMEMGSPMVSMYLLGNPDHYKSHEFTVFYWQSYRHGRIVGLSPVYDYIYRPAALSDMSLYSWVRRCRREKIPKKASKAKKFSEQWSGAKDDDKADENESEGESYLENNDNLDVSPDAPCSSDNNAQVDPVELGWLRKGVLPFPEPHPLAGTHGTRCVSEDKALVPNFAGPMLPRPDQGDREYYCSTMLALFKPWRSGLDLKEKQETWDMAFLNYDFTERQKELMGNFNLKYECLDARDDFYAQMR